MKAYLGAISKSRKLLVQENGRWYNTIL